MPMSVRELRSQEAEHDSGIILRGLDRYTMQLEHRGRKLSLGVDRAPGRVLFYVPKAPAWNDGNLIGEDELELLQRVVTEIEAFWGTSADFRRLGR
jgi:hypothetical protein